MNSHSFVILLALAATWGASFLFMRIAAPEFGPILMTHLRVALAACCLAPWLLWRHRHEIHWKNQPALMLVGLSNSALPFCLLGFATLHLTAGATAILNSSVPFWSALIAWLWFADRLTRWQQLGLVLAFSGVVALGLYQSGFSLGGPGLAVLAAMLATLSYGFSANFSKRTLREVPALIVAGLSLAWASILLTPLSLNALPETWPSLKAWVAVFLLALLCTALAFIFFYQLVSQIGPTHSVSVTFLVPLFGMFWGGLILDEQVTPGMLAGCAVILLGTSLSLGLWHPPGKWLRRGKRP